MLGLSRPRELGGLGRALPEDDVGIAVPELHEVDAHVDEADGLEARSCDLIGVMIASCKHLG